MSSISVPRGDSSETIFVQLSNEELARKIAALKNHAFPDSNQSISVPSSFVYSDIDYCKEFPYSSEWYRGKGDVAGPVAKQLESRSIQKEPTSKSNSTFTPSSFACAPNSLTNRISEKYSGLLLQRNARDFRSDNKQTNCDNVVLKSRTNGDVFSYNFKDLPSVSTRDCAAFPSGHTSSTSSLPCYLSNEDSVRSLVQENNNFFVEHSLDKIIASCDSSTTQCSTPSDSSDSFIKSKLSTPLTKHYVRLPTDGSILEELNRRYSTKKSTKLSQENNFQPKVPSVVISPALPSDDEVFQKALISYSNMVVDGDVGDANAEEKAQTSLDGSVQRERSMSSASSTDSRLTSECDNECVSTDEEISDETVNENFQDTHSEKSASHTEWYDYDSVPHTTVIPVVWWDTAGGRKNR